jgi:hypothetical protein
MACFAEWAEDDEEPLNVLEACGRRVLDLRAVHEVDVPALEHVRHNRATLTTSLWSFRIQLVPFTKRCLLLGVSEVELRMVPLGLQHIGSLHELPRLSPMRRLVLALACRSLVLAIAALVDHCLVISQAMFQYSWVDADA